MTQERKFEAGDRVRVVRLLGNDRGLGIRVGDVFTIKEIGGRPPYGLDCHNPSGRNNLSWAEEEHIELVERPIPFPQAFIADIDARGGLNNIGADALEVLGVWYAKAKEVER